MKTKDLERCSLAEWKRINLAMRDYAQKVSRETGATFDDAVREMNKNAERVAGELKISAANVRAWAMGQ